MKDRAGGHIRMRNQASAIFLAHHRAAACLIAPRNELDGDIAWGADWLSCDVNKLAGEHNSPESAFTQELHLHQHNPLMDVDEGFCSEVARWRWLLSCMQHVSWSSAAH